MLRHAPVSDLRQLLFPRSVAIVGASPRRAETIQTTQRSGVTVWAVNPGRDEVLGLPCHPSVASLPETPDVALVLVGHERVQEAVEEALDAGVRAFVVPGVGAEAGEHARTVSAQLGAAVAAAGAEWISRFIAGAMITRSTT